MNCNSQSRLPLQEISVAAQNAIKKSQKKRGPKPKSLSDRVRKWDPPAKRIKRSYSRGKKLRVLSYWFYALVPNDKTGGWRHVTRAEVSARYMIPGATMSGWKTQLRNLIEMARHERLMKPGLTCAYPEMETKLFDRFLERQQEGKLVRRGWFRLASRWLFNQCYPDLNQTQFRFSNGWFLGFLSRWGITLRVTTNKAQKISEDYRNRII